jgi:hypothetical protein
MNVIIKENNALGTNHEHKLYYTFDGKQWVERWEVNEDAARMLMDNHIQELEPVRNQVHANELSPLAYHIESKLFNINILSSYTGFSKRHIKKHLKPKNFNQLDEESLKKYADAFGISVEELNKV